MWLSQTTLGKIGKATVFLERDKVKGVNHFYVVSNYKHLYRQYNGDFAWSNIEMPLMCRKEAIKLWNDYLHSLNLSWLEEGF